MCVIRRLADGWAALLMLKPPKSIKNRNIAISIPQFKTIWVRKSLCLFSGWEEFENDVNTSIVLSHNYDLIENEFILEI